MLDEKYYSKLQSMIIPLYGFKSYHHASSCEDDIKNFIGRKSIIDKLAAWLKESPASKYTGAYLITGYRGMGKSTFVYKAITQLRKENEKVKYRRYSPNDKTKYIPIAVNVGNELLETKELLAMICKLTAYEFNRVVSGRYGFISRLNTIIMVILINLPFLFYVLSKIFKSLPLYSAIVPAIRDFIETYIFFFLSHSTIKTIIIIAFCLILFFSGYIANKLLYLLWKHTDWDYFITVRHIKHTWGYLLERISAEITKEIESGGNTVAERLHGIGLYFKYGTTAVYPIAKVPEMQEMLVKILDLAYRHKFTKLRFIYVIDELDKLSPKDEEKMTMPEYESTNLVNGSSTHRSRQNALASMIANMKYFISSSRAKFIFITGYDMYEATLSDISDREFSIHSIFNGQINVSSFFRKTANFSGVDSMMEQYLCKLLMNKEENPSTGNVEEKIKNLTAYAQYHKKKWDELLITERQQTIFQKTLERRIVFLHNFLTYLIYLSNGSPKKLAIYIEKNIRTKNTISRHLLSSTETISFCDINLGLGDAEYYLYFDSRNLMRICFVNYLIYPMVQNLIDKSNIYNDKLLVSTSFMLSNLYKFHKSGFSMRNLEYMPELLAINKTPELRDFIGGIVEFMTQTHIDETMLNLYKYKFPMRLSEEITYFSKTSEEISYLFNFSHDELLSVKRLYMLQLQHYTDKHEVLATASLHHMLGDIYMLEENYELAIYEFQEAISSLKRQETTRATTYPYKFKETSRTLFYVRVSLKLGLAYEKRKTLDTAYIHYKNLVDSLLKHAQSIKGYNILSYLGLWEKENPLMNIRIMYLAPLAKLFVLEKMDMGGFTVKDIKTLMKEHKTLINGNTQKTRPLVSIDFYNKYGDILYYRNIKDKCFMIAVREGINKKHIKAKNRRCEDLWKDKKHFSPCVACLCYNKSIMTFLERSIGYDQHTFKYDTESSKSLIFLEWIYNPQKKNFLSGIGKTYIYIIANSLVGMGNCLLGCAKKNTKNEKSDICNNKNTLYSFFAVLNNAISNNCANNIKAEFAQEKVKLTSYMKSILYYLAASEIYALAGEYKTAYNIACQILDAIFAYLRICDIQEDGTESITIFSKRTTEKAIQYAFEHYRHINAAEIDKLKSALGISPIEKIDLDYLSNFPDIEIVIYKYYQIQLICNNDNKKIQILNNLLDSRQLGTEKLISSFTQDIQNMYFKVLMNEHILFLIMPEIKTIFTEGNHKLISTLHTIRDYFYYDTHFLSVIKNMKWHIFNDNDTICDKKYQLLKYLITDSLFCLNKISDLIVPLYNTPLYNNTYIGEIYEKGFVWNHILIVLREILLYAQSDNKEAFLQNIKERYNLEQNNTDFTTILDSTSDYISTVPSWINERARNVDTVNKLYDRICPSSHRRLTSSYLIGNALDYYKRAIDMHSSGKTYKEMMTTLYFLEDDLSNDSLYLNFAIELYYLNTNFVQKRMEILMKYYNSNKHKGLFQINNYIN